MRDRRRAPSPWLLAPALALLAAGCTSSGTSGGSSAAPSLAGAGGSVTAAPVPTPVEVSSGPVALPAPSGESVTTEGQAAQESLLDALFAGPIPLALEILSQIFLPGPAAAPAPATALPQPAGANDNTPLGLLRASRAMNDSPRLPRQPGDGDPRGAAIRAMQREQR